MTDILSTSDFKFRAFISYSWLDRLQADAIYARLEQFKVPSELVSGDRSRQIGRVFIDREFAKAGSLTKVIRDALSSTEYLIVVCSPNSRKSAFVSEEIRIFKSLGRGENILPIIIDGKPNCPELNCFPEALKWRVDGEGTVTDEQDEEILAPDVRDSVGGLDVAVTRLVAGMLGLEPLDLLQRQATAERNRRRRATGIAAVMSLLFVASAMLAWFADKQATIARDQTSLARAKTEEAEARKQQSYKISFRIADKVQELSNDLQIPTNQAIKLTEAVDAEVSELAMLDPNSEIAHYGVAKTKLQKGIMLGRLGDSVSWSEDAKRAKEEFKNSFVRARHIWIISKVSARQVFKSRCLCATKGTWMKPSRPSMMR